MNIITAIAISAGVTSGLNSAGNERRHQELLAAIKGEAHVPMCIYRTPQPWWNTWTFALLFFASPFILFLAIVLAPFWLPVIAFCWCGSKNNWLKLAGALLAIICVVSYVWAAMDCGVF